MRIEIKREVYKGREQCSMLCNLHTSDDGEPYCILDLEEGDMGSTPGPDCKPGVYELVPEGSVDGAKAMEQVATDAIREVDRLRAENKRLRNALEEIPRRIPAHSQGEFFFEHFDINGEYVGAEQVNPADIIASIHSFVMAALEVQP